MSNWEAVHETLLTFRKKRVTLEREESIALLAAKRMEVHIKFGLATFSEYVERMLGYRSRELRERLRVASELEELPQMCAMLEAGSLNWSAARETSRVATPQTEAVWLQAIEGRTLRQIEAIVSGKSKGDLPTDVAPRRLGKRQVRFAVTPETYATVEQAKDLLRRTIKGPVDDDTLFLLMARTILARGAQRSDCQEKPPGYQVNVNICPGCRDTKIGETAVGATTGEMAMCASDETISVEVRRAAIIKYGRRCAAPACRIKAFVDLHTIDHDGTPDAADVVLLCGHHHRALHMGTIVITRVGEDIVFRHADGRPYGIPSTTAHHFACAQQALRSKGFPDSKARHLIHVVATRVGHVRSSDELVDAVVAYLEGKKVNEGGGA